MKKIYYLIFLLFISTCTLTMTGCDEDGDTDCELFGDCGGSGGGGGGGGSSNGEIVFWNNQSWVGDITVTIGSDYDVITQNVSSPYCGHSGCANFNGSPGSYYYYASATTGETWSGYASISAGNCTTFQLY